MPEILSHLIQELPSPFDFVMMVDVVCEASTSTLLAKRSQFNFNESHILYLPLLKIHKLQVP